MTGETNHLIYFIALMTEDFLGDFAMEAMHTKMAPQAYLGEFDTYPASMIIELLK